MNGKSTLARVGTTSSEARTTAWPQPATPANWTDASTEWIGAPFIAKWPLAWPFGLTVLFTAIFRCTNADIVISDWFYDHSTQEWTWFFNTGCTLFYRRGIYPAFVLFGVSVVAQAAAIVMKREKLYRAGLFLSLLFIIGPGLIVNYGFKNHWGRPRPHQIDHFNGPMAFVPLGSPGIRSYHNSSFPSGHAAVAFYLIGPSFLVNSRRRGLAGKLMITGLVFGGAMALVRVMQGGHFVSDVVWSAAIVYFTAVGLSVVVLRPRSPVTRPQES